jgi:hypothetical protein
MTKSKGPRRVTKFIVPSAAAYLGLHHLSYQQMHQITRHERFDAPNNPSLGGGDTTAILGPASAPGARSGFA